MLFLIAKLSLFLRREVINHNKTVQTSKTLKKKQAETSQTRRKQQPRVAVKKNGKVSANSVIVEQKIEHVETKTWDRGKSSHHKELFFKKK